MGDFSGSRGSVENTYLPKAISKGVHVKEKCKVIRLIPDKSQKLISQVFYKDHLGNIHSCKGKVIIIAASGIGTPRLLLGSKSSNFPNGIGNSSSQIGRNLMLHPLGYVEGQVLKNLYSNLGPQGCCLLSQEFTKTE